MSKRVAEKQLTADNWDEDDGDGAEEEPVFNKVASEEVLKTRIIKTAKRRIQPSSETGVPNVFGGFAGFKKTSTESSASPFGFLSKLTNGGDGKSTSTTAEIGRANETSGESGPKGESAIPSEKRAGEYDAEYCSNLKNLNMSVCEWIKSHVDKNPYCILTPIFEDYKKHLSELDKKKTMNFDKTPPVSHEGGKVSLFSHLNAERTETKEAPSFSIGSSLVDETLKSSIFSTSGDKLNFTRFSMPAVDANFNFSSTPMSKAPTFGFGATPSEAPSFAGGAPPMFKGPDAGEPEEDEEPPKVEITPVTEEGSVYSKRCKVFVKKEDGYADRGVGTLFVKPIGDSEKHQLIVRAETSLGNLLLNLVLSASVPLRRLGKNNVMMMCVPTPESKPPPVSTLLRVKTGEEADELLKALEKYQK